MPKRSYATYAGRGQYLERPSAKRTKFNRRQTIPRTVLNDMGATGRIPAKKTTLATFRAAPFRNKKMVSFEYTNALTLSGLAASEGVIQVSPNDMFDFDKSGSVVGNKQPLYYDTLLSSSGPYKTFKVISWETTWTIINNATTTPITVWAFPPTLATAEIDSAAEADNFPGMKMLYLTALTGAKNIGTITVKGHVKDAVPSYSNDASLTGAFNGSPGTPIYQGLYIKAADGSTTPSVYVAVRHVAYTELGYIDALVS